ncbi:hypothetical protein GCM10009038_15640 [Salinicola rhizosphaerae]|uniref:Four-carbon acid sugar kinase N-terminal domain-containing protein n=1 Tax=Salinicola rhizosphaerae TaxID=1443141 RepID=A0ABQ3DWU4_9GAMM|nr:hypothetical protein GCM10009038_15640 [Salinicola rhizosphaerae]
MPERRVLLITDASSGIGEGGFVAPAGDEFDDNIRRLELGLQVCFR